MNTLEETSRTPSRPAMVGKDLFEGHEGIEPRLRRRLRIPRGDKTPESDGADRALWTGSRRARGEPRVADAVGKQGSRRARPNVKRGWLPATVVDPRGGKPPEDPKKPQGRYQGETWDGRRVRELYLAVFGQSGRGRAHGGASRRSRLERHGRRRSRVW
jgi:hypothetical protein